MNNDNKFLKTGQVAEMLNIPQRTIQDWTKKGILVPDQTSANGYNFYSFKTVIDFSKTAQNLQKCLKNSSIKSIYIYKPKNWDKIFLLWKNRDITAGEAIKLSGLPRSSFYRLAQRERAK